MKMEEIDFVICGDGRVECTIPSREAFDGDVAIESLELEGDEVSLLDALARAIAEDQAEDQIEIDRMLIIDEFEKHLEGLRKSAPVVNLPEPAIVNPIDPHFHSTIETLPVRPYLTPLWNWKRFWIAAIIGAAIMLAALGVSK